MIFSSKVAEVFFVSLISALPAPSQVDVVRPYVQTAAAVVTVTLGLMQISDRCKKTDK